MSGKLFFRITDDIVIPIIGNRNENITQMNDLRPVYLCKNAMKREHQCKWAVCYSCKIEHDEKERNRFGEIQNKRRSFRNNREENEQDVRIALNNKYDNNMCSSSQESKHLCRHDHKYLSDFCAKEYFTKTYQDKILADEIQFPTHCVSCNCRISSSD